MLYEVDVSCKAACSSARAVSHTFKPQIKMAVDALHIFIQGPPAVGIFVAKNKGAVHCVT